MRTHGMGLLIQLCDSDAEAEDDFRNWIDRVYLPNAMHVPGIRGGAAYEAVRGAPRFLTLVEAESVHVFYSGPFLEFCSTAAEEGPARKPEGPIRLVCVQMYPGLPIPPHPCPTVEVAGLGPVVQLGRIHVPPENQADFHGWYAQDRAPRTEELQGMRRIRRYAPVEGDRVNVVLYEMEDTSVLEGPAWEAVRNSDWSLRVREYYRQAPGSPGLFKRRGFAY